MFASSAAGWHRLSPSLWSRPRKKNHTRKYRITVIKAMSSVPSPQMIQTRISVASATGRLDLSNCGLQKVPPEVFALTELEELSLSGNGITYIPDDIRNLRKLRRLGLSGNWLSELPTGLGELQNLEALWVQGNILEVLPMEVGNLVKISVFALTGNMLIEIPESIRSLSCLKVLSLSGNKLQRLPSGIGDLVNLKVLAANGNVLETLPESIVMLSLLEELSLQGNRIRNLPESFGRLKSLKEFHLADNGLEGLPASIGELPCLETFSLYGNNIKELPSSLCNLKKLCYLWLEGNTLNSFPDCLHLATDCKAIGIDSNTAKVFPSRLHSALGEVLQISKILGTGRVHSLGGYFKLQQYSEDPAEVVVVAFGSAPGVPNWAGLLKRIKKALLASGKQPAFDILYVVDCRRSWYTENKMGAEPQRDQLEGNGERRSIELCSYYQKELQAALEPYKRVVMIGDSMGASAALTFSPLATSVIAFCPQVDLAASAIRPGKDKVWLDTFKKELLDAVLASSANIVVHCGSWEHDLHQAKLLPAKVMLVVHNNDDHRLATKLDKQGSLLNIVQSRIEEEISIAYTYNEEEMVLKTKLKSLKLNNRK